MNCRHAQRAASAAMDGEHLSSPERLATQAHVATCSDCRAFVDRSTQVRTAVRIRPAEHVPDLTEQIMAAVASGSVRPARHHGSVRPRRSLPAIAAAIAGLLVGSLIVGGPWASRSHTATAAEIARAIRQVAPSIDAFQGSYVITEHGLAPDVPVRTLAMDVAFLAPQRFRLDVRDETIYPTAAWTPTDIDYIEDMPATYLSGPTGCPGTLPPADCPPTRETVTRATPYSPAAPLPADLIAPIATFGSADGVRVLGSETVAGHDTVRVEMSFARAAPLFPFLRLDGTWRPFFVDDVATVWLDATGWYPVRIDVTPSTDVERRSWEMRFGLPHEPAGSPILDVSLASVSPGPPDPSLFTIPGLDDAQLSLGDAPHVLGYVPAVPTSPGTLGLASVVAPPASATAPSSVLVYADGLDYLRIGENRGWSGPVPFGPVTLDAERVKVPGIGPALYEPAGSGLDRRLAIHATDTDLFLETNLPRGDLLAITATIGIHAERLPRTWRVSRAGAVTIERVQPEAALADVHLEGFANDLPAGYVAASAMRTIHHQVATGITITFRQLDTDAVGPPLTLHRGTVRAAFLTAPDQVRVAIGATPGRYSPSGSVLTWLGHGQSWSLQGDVDLARLVEIASSVIARTQ